MPIYEYKCDDNDHRFEKKQSISEDPITHCEVCESPAKRLISKNVGISFKGNGFYVTDSNTSKSASSTEKIN